MSRRRCAVSLTTLLFITLCHSAVPEYEKSSASQETVKKTDGLTTNGKGAGGSSSKFECVSEDTECTKDKLGYEAIGNLHRLLDDDNNGNVDQAESDEFLRDELQYTDGFERVSLFHNNDKLISVDDLWRAWKFSKVYNWTVDEVVDWLVTEVELPQYSSIFSDNSVCGSFLPRIATSNTFMSTILGIKNPVHKQKLTLKAMDTVLFGPPPKRHNHLKDLALTLLLLVAVGGCWFGIAHHRYSQAQVRKMTHDLENLQKAEDALTEMQKKLEDAESKQVSAVPQPHSDVADGHGPPLRYVSGCSGGSSEEGADQMREELAAMQLALQQAETQLGQGHQGYAPPGELQAWLQLTHELELGHYMAKRQAAERQFMAAKDSCDKIKKRNKAIFGSLRMAHSNSVDEIDQRIMDAKVALEEVKQDLQERLQRWHTIERLCGFQVITNPGLQILHQLLYTNKEGGGRMMTTTSSSPALDETEEDVRPAGPTGYVTLPQSHSNTFLRQRMSAMGSTGSLSTVSRGVGAGMMHPPTHQPPHLIRRGSHDPDSPAEGGNHADHFQEHALVAGNLSGAPSYPSMDRNRSFSLTTSIASSQHSTFNPPHSHHPQGHNVTPNNDLHLPPTLSGPHHSNNNMHVVPPSGQGQSQGQGHRSQGRGLSLDQSDDNLSQATLDSLTPSQSGSNVHLGVSLDNSFDGQGGGGVVGPDSGGAFPRKKRSVRRKVLDIFKKDKKKGTTTT